MDGPLVFYTNPQSRGRIVRWMLEEVGVPYETQLLDYVAVKAPDYLAINPAGKIPAIKHGSAIVTEVVAICAYLADLFPQAHLLPQSGDAEARAAYYRWLFFVAGPLESAIADKVLNISVPEDKRRAIGHGNADEASAILEAALKGRDYIAGNHFTAADLVLSAYLGFYMMFGMLAPNPDFERYVALHKGRPAAQRAEALDNQLMQGGR